MKNRNCNIKEVEMILAGLALDSFKTSHTDVV